MRHNGLHTRLEVHLEKAQLLLSVVHGDVVLHMACTRFLHAHRDFNPNGDNSQYSLLG